jgi:hypothetical protein
MALAKGNFWRLAGSYSVLAALALGALIVMFLLLIAFHLAASSLGVMQHGSSGWMDAFVDLSSVAFMQGLLYPFFFIAQVLLYYDLRVRKEAYDVAVLAEDMMR